MTSASDRTGSSGPDPASAGAGDCACRLSDKILQAFNHAYAVGEVDVAASLRRLLEKRGRRGARDGRDRGASDPIRRANLWVQFVDSRNRYRAACDNRRGDATATADALEDMKEAYRRWCEG